MLKGGASQQIELARAPQTEMELVELINAQF
jgi:hypothetical protein